MPYLGTLTRDMLYTLEVETALPFAATVMHIRRDRLAEVEVLLFDAASGAPHQRTIGSSVDRVVFLMTTFVTSSAVIKVSQGTSLHEVRAGPDALMTFDVI